MQKIKEAFDCKGDCKLKFGKKFENLEKALLGGDGHDLKPHGKSNLLGGDGHDLKPHGNSAPEDGGSFGLLLNGSPMLNGDVGDLCQWGVFQQFQERFKRLYMSKQGT